MSIESDFAEIKYEDVTSFSSIDSPSLSKFNEWLAGQKQRICPEVVLNLTNSNGKGELWYDILSLNGQNWGEMDLWVREPQAVEREALSDAHTEVNLFWYKRRIINFQGPTPRGVGRAAVCTAIDMVKAVDPSAEFYIDSVTTAGLRVVRELVTAEIMQKGREFEPNMKGLFSGYVSV